MNPTRESYVVSVVGVNIVRSNHKRAQSLTRRLEHRSTSSQSFVAQYDPSLDGLLLFHPCIKAKAKREFF